MTKEALDFADSVEATDAMDEVLSLLINAKLENWAVATDYNYGTRSMDALKRAITAYKEFLGVMNSAD